MGTVLYEDKPKWDLWAKLFLAFFPAIFIILGLLFYYGVLLSEETKEDLEIVAVVFFAIATFCLLVYWAVFPRGYVVLEDRLRIKFGVFKTDIPFNDIKEAKPGKGTMFLFFGGLDAALSLKTTIEIKRKYGMDVRISPQNRDLFLEELNKAIASWKRSQGMI